MRNWKKRISSILICSMLVSSFAPQMRFTANGTTYAPDYEDDIVAEDSEDYDSDYSSSYEEYLEANNYSDAEIARILEEDPYGELASDSNWELASDSNWNLASDSNWELASGSNWEPMDIVSFTDVGPFLPFAPARNLKSRMISTIDEDIIDNAGIETTKTAKKIEDIYQITLEAYTTGTVTNEEKKIPTDIVLVLDVSNSMKQTMERVSYSKLDREIGAIKGAYVWTTKDNWNADYKYEIQYRNNKWQYYETSKKGGGQWKDLPTSSDNYFIAMTRLGALKVAARNFVDSIAADAQASGKQVDHRVSIIDFAADADKDRDLCNVSLINPGSENSLKTRIDGLTVDDSTNQYAGLREAKEVLDSVTRESNKVVVLFTDGEPTAPTKKGESEDYKYNVAIEQSYNIKQMPSTTVYTIGVMDGADGSPVADVSSNSVGKINRFLHLISSNYRYAESLSQPGNSTYPGNNKSYYLTPKNPNELNDIFQQISDQVSKPAIDLGAETVVKDVMSNYFRLPKDAKDSDIKVYTQEAIYSNGELNWGDRKLESLQATINDDKSAVEVKGFDFSDNFVSETGRTHGNDTDFHGKKLVIEFTIVPRDGFFGGNAVPTNNTSASGIISKKEGLVENFPVPSPVDVTLAEIQINPANKNVYLMNSLDSANMMSGAELKVGNTNVTFNANGNYVPLTGTDAWKDDYVNLSLTTSNAMNNLVEDSLVNNNAGYSLTMEVTPTKEGTATANSETAKDNVYVFKPELTFKDGNVWYGEDEPKNYTDYMTNKTWKHGNTEATPNIMVGGADAEPTITMNIAVVNPSDILNGKINSKHDDILVNVNDVYLNGNTSNDVVENTTIHRTKCSDDEKDLNNEGHFVLHPKTVTLTIEKTFPENKDAADEPFVFTIYKDGNEDDNVYTQVSIKGAGSATIKELPVGTYSIKEDDKWSWRYESSVTGPVTLDRNNTTDTLTCRNKKVKKQWLNGLSTVVKNVFGEAKEGGASR